MYIKVGCKNDSNKGAFLRNVTSMNIATGSRDRGKLRLMQLHRLLEFEKSFTLYLEGKVSAARVAARAKKMLEVGLPRLK